MLSHLTTRPVLAATTSAAAICLGLIVVLPLTSVKVPTTALPKVAERAAPVPAPLHETADALIAAEPAAPPPAPAMRSAREAGGMMGSIAPAYSPATAPMPMLRAVPQADAETFANATANPVKITAEEPVSTFSADVDTASWAMVRSSLMRGQLPPENAVRIEEMVNYFPYAYPAPEEGEAPFRASVSVFPTPWNADTRLVRIGLQDGGETAQQEALAIGLGLGPHLGHHRGEGLDFRDASGGDKGFDLSLGGHGPAFAQDGGFAAGKVVVERTRRNTGRVADHLDRDGIPAVFDP